MSVELNVYYTGRTSSNNSRTFLIVATTDASTSYQNVLLDVQLIGNVNSLQSSFSSLKFSLPKGTSQPLMLIDTMPKDTTKPGTVTVSATLTLPGGEIVTANKYVGETATTPETYIGVDATYTGGSGSASSGNYSVNIGDSFDCRIEGNSTRTHDIVLIPNNIRMGAYIFNNQNFITLASGIVCTETSASRPYIETEVEFDPEIIGPTMPDSRTSGRYMMLCFTKQGSSVVGGYFIKLASAQNFTMTMPLDICTPIIAVNSVIDKKGYEETYGAYVGTKSEIQVTVSVSGRYGATIKNIVCELTPENTASAELSYSYTWSSSDPSTENRVISLGIPTNSGSKRIRVAATDSRNVYATNNASTLTVVPYVSPSLTFRANRWDTENNKENDGSDTVRLVGEAIVPNVNNVVVEDNLLAFNMRLKGETNWTNVSSFLVDGPNITKIQDVLNQSVDNSYEYQAVITDAFGTSIASEGYVGTATPVLEFNASGKGVGIGTVAPEVGLDIGMQTNFRGVSEDGYSRIQITDPDGTNSVILANLAGSTLQLLLNAAGAYDRALIGSHVFTQNNKAVGSVTTSGSQIPILRLNTSDLVELTWTMGGLRGRVGKQLWTGTANPGSTITVPELAYYNVIVIYDGGSRPGLAVKTTFGATTSSGGAAWFGMASEPQTDNIWLKSFGAEQTSATDLKISWFTHIDIKNNYRANAEQLTGIRGLL